MRFIWHLLAVLLLLALLGISTVGVMAYMPSFGGRLIRLNAMGNSIIDTWRPANGLFWMWLGLFFGTFLAFLTGGLSMRRQKQISVQMGGGRVVILESAIRKYVRTALLDIPDISTRRIGLLTTRNGIDVDVRVHVKTNQKLPDLERKVIDRVRTALAEELGISSVGSVHVSVLDVELANRPETVRRARAEENRDEERREEETTESEARAVVLRPPARRSQPMEASRPVVVVNPEHSAQIFEPYRPSAAELRDESSPYGIREAIKEDLRPTVSGQFRPEDAQTVSKATEASPPAEETLFVAGDLEDVPATMPEGQKNDDLVEAGPAAAAEDSPAADQTSGEQKKKRRGLFGLWSRDEVEPTLTNADEQIASESGESNGSSVNSDLSLEKDSSAPFASVHESESEPSESAGKVDRS